MGVIELRFVSGSKVIPSGIIRYLTRCRWSHVEAISGSMTLGAQLQGGVRWRDIMDPCYGRDDLTEMVAINCEDQQFKKFWDFLGSQLNDPYDWRAILGFSLGDRDWREEGSWFCSELIARGLEVTGLVKFPQNIPVWRLTPRDVWLLVRGL